MTEPVKRYVTTCDCMSEAGWGDYVRHDDYARLEQECDTAMQLLAQCQERLHPHRDAVLWGAVVEALRCAPTK